MLNFLFGGKKVARLNFSKSKESEFAYINDHFQRFLDLQHLMLCLPTGDMSKVDFKNAHEIRRYLSFFLGAADKLSRAIEDEVRSHAWWSSVCLMQAFEVVKDQTKAIDVLEAYGDESNAEQFNAGRVGWEAMYEYMRLQASERDDDVKALKQSGLMLTKVVRGY